MSMEEQKAAEVCAIFMGIKIIRWSLGQIWIADPAAGEGCGCPYDPAGDDPASREQANELWKKLHANGRYVDIGSKVVHVCKNGIQIRSKTTIGASIYADANLHERVAFGEGPWWNSALTSAVAELQKGRERNDRARF